MKLCYGTKKKKSKDASQANFTEDDKKNGATSIRSNNGKYKGKQSNSYLSQKQFFSKSL